MPHSSSNMSQALRLLFFFFRGSVYMCDNDHDEMKQTVSINYFKTIPKYVATMNSNTVTKCNIRLCKHNTSLDFFFVSISKLTIRSTRSTMKQQDIFEYWKLMLPSFTLWLIPRYSYERIWIFLSNCYISPKAHSEHFC